MSLISEETINAIEAHVEKELGAASMYAVLAGIARNAGLMKLSAEFKEEALSEMGHAFAFGDFLADVQSQELSVPSISEIKDAELDVLGSMEAIHAEALERGEASVLGFMLPHLREQAGATAAAMRLVAMVESLDYPDALMTLGA